MSSELSGGAFRRGRPGRVHHGITRLLGFLIAIVVLNVFVAANQPSLIEVWEQYSCNRMILPASYIFVLGFLGFLMTWMSDIEQEVSEESLNAHQNRILFNSILAPLFTLFTLNCSSALPSPSIYVPAFLAIVASFFIASKLNTDRSWLWITAIVWALSASTLFYPPLPEAERVPVIALQEIKKAPVERATLASATVPAARRRSASAMLAEKQPISTIADPLNTTTPAEETGHAEESEGKCPPIPDPLAPPVTDSSHPVHVVQDKETLIIIAREHHTTWQAIVAANAERYPDLNPDCIWPGMLFVIPNLMGPAVPE